VHIELNRIKFGMFLYVFSSRVFLVLYATMLLNSTLNSKMAQQCYNARRKIACFA